MNAVIDKIPALVAEELEAANNIHGPFHSPHEGWAVLKEEVEEAQAEMEAVASWLKAMWLDIKEDCGKAQSLARGVEWRAIRVAAEAVQVAAMARKFIASVSGSDVP